MNIHSVGAYIYYIVKKVNCGYQNDDHSVSLIPKRDPRITNFSIPDPGVENSIPGLQSLAVTTSIAKWTNLHNSFSVTFTDKLQKKSA